MIELSSNISNYILHHFGEDYLGKYKDYSNSKYQAYIRVSPFADVNILIQDLKKYGIEISPVRNIDKSFIVNSGENLIGKTLEFILGHYYVQSLSSMIPALVLNPSQGEKVLDLCAAPGSKTTQLAELMQNKGTLVANEISMERMKSLVFNVDKMNLVNVGILHGKGELLSREYEEYFDKILVDAPCSALGITQKKGEVSNWWNENKLVTFSDLQLKLLIAALKMCKVGGEIVYSTCTLSLEENEVVLQKLLQKYPVELLDFELPIESNQAFTRYESNKLDSNIAKAHRILPWQINSEGFFIAKIRKIDHCERASERLKYPREVNLINSNNVKIKNELSIMAKYYGIDPEVLHSYKYLLRSKDIYFCNNDWHASNLDKFIRIGSKLGSIEKRGYIQLHTLASQIFGKNITQNLVPLNYKPEIEIYLKGGTIKKMFTDTGQKVIIYNNQIIGTAVASKDALKSQFPREYRTQEIMVR